MSTIGIRIVYAGNSSRVGHMYIVFKDDAGRTTTFGHYPMSAVDAIGGLGGVRENFDLDEHERRNGAPGTNGVPDISRDFSVSNSAFQAALDYSRVAASQAGDKTKPWGIYTPLYNSCVDFSWNVMREAGLVEGNWFEGFFLPGWNKNALDDAYFDYFRRPEFRREDKHSITSVINTTYRIAAAIRPPAPRDPLALDLDGDGIETIGVTASPVLFDHNADGIRTGTGWVTGDDGWLVLDRNGNGVIDSGRELFGEDTVLSGTPGIDAVYATTGFQALATLDVGDGSAGSIGFADNMFNASDAAYSQVRVWQDLNQDGLSQAGELFSLAQKNIVSISLTSNNASINLGNGNTVSGTTTVTRSNGTTTLAGSVSVASDTTAANLNLGSNPFYREFATAVPLTAAAQALPEMGGSGWVRDLREAMSLGTPQGDALAADVAQFASATTRDAQVAMLDDFLRLWAETNQTQVVGPRDDPRRRFVLSGDATTSARLQFALPLLEVFNGMNVADSGMQAPSTSVGSDGLPAVTYGLFANQAPVMLAAYDALKESVYRALVLQTRLRPYLDSIELVLDANGITFKTDPVSALLNAAKAVDERVAMLDLVDLNRYASPTLLATGFDGLQLLAGWVNALPPGAALRSELLALDVFAAATGAGTLRDDIYLGDSGANTFTAGDGNDALYGGAGVDNLSGGNGNDTLDGGTGNDILAGGLGNNIYLFGLGDGQDTVSYISDLTAGKLNVLRFKAGVDPTQIVARRVYDADFSRSDPNNALYSSLELGIVGTTDKITIRGAYDYDDPSNQYNGLQRIEFANGTVWGLPEITARTLLGTDLADSLRGTLAADTIGGGLGNDTISGGAGDDVLSGGAGNDVLAGDAGNDVLDGGDGNDSLNGGEGNNQLAGGAGVDTLSAGNGNDTLDGGTGNDTLAGGLGNNVYLFGLGDGQDTVSYISDLTAGKLNVLRFKAGIDPTQIIARRVYDADFSRSDPNNAAYASLELSITGTTDKIMVRGAYDYDDPSNQYNGLQRIEFANGTVWSLPEITARTLQSTDLADSLRGTLAADTISGGLGNDTLSGGAGDDMLNGDAGNDMLTGDSGNDTLNGADGNDTLNGNDGNDLLSGGTGTDALTGGNGNDTLDGGTGNDNLAGGLGNNVYLFGLGDGQDTVSYISDLTAGKLNVLRFKAGIDPTQIIAKRVYDADFSRSDPNNALYASLELVVAGTTDKITIRGAYDFDDPSNQYNGLQRIEFANGTVWGLPEITARTLLGTDLADSLRGTLAADTISGGLGNDTISGGSGDDILSGGAGNDVLAGDAGNDVLDGGDGNDSLSGGEGNNQLAGGAGADALSAGNGNDTLDGGTGNDTLAGGLGNNIYLFGLGDGQDTINYISDLTAGKLNVLRFKAGIDPMQIVARRVYDADFSRSDPSNAAYASLELSIAGTTDKITIRGAYDYDNPSNQYNGVQRIEFANGTVWGLPQITARTLLSTDLADSLRGTLAADTISGGLGNDTISGGAGDDVLSGGAGNDVLAGDAGNDVLDGGDGNDSLSGGEGNNQLAGGAGADTLSAGSGNDVLAGGADADSLSAGSGNDTLDGGTGNDILAGGLGNNIYLFGLGDGQDTVSYISDLTAGKLNVLRFKAGIDPTQIIAKRVYDADFSRSDPNNALYASLELVVAGTTDKITIRGAYDYDDSSNQYNGLQRIEFANGTVWGLPEITARTLQSTDLADSLRGTLVADTISGGLGNDTISGGAGDDVLSGGAGNDVLAGDAGNDVLDGGDGNDSLNGGEGNNQLAGGAGVDSLSAGSGNDVLAGGADADSLSAGSGNDTLDGGTGNDILAGGLGNNIYLFGLGDGQDTINYISDLTAGKLNVLRFKAGIDPMQIVARRVYDADFSRSDPSNAAYASLELSIAGTTDKITIRGAYDYDNPSNQYNGVQRIEFANGTVWGLPQITARTLLSTDLADSLRGTLAADTINGGLGNDTISGGAGDDLINGDAGNDMLTGDSGNDKLNGADGNDTLNGNDGNDLLSGGTGTDALTGGNGNDTLDGGTGNDNLAGGLGNNLYLFGLGDGQDTISYISDLTAGKLNVLRFKAGIDPTQIIAKRVYDADFSRSDPSNAAYASLELSIAGTTDKITIRGAYDYDNPSNQYNGVQRIEFANGTVWGLPQITARTLLGTDVADSLRGTLVADTISGGLGNDTISGGSGDDILSGGAGNDVITGDMGNDTLDGGADNDTLSGGVGNDRYLLARGHGVDTAYDNDTTAGNTDLALFNTGIAADQLWFRQVSNNLEVSIIGTADRLSIGGWYSGNQYHLEQFKTSDGKTLLDSQVQNLVNAMAAFAPPAIGQTSLSAAYASQLAPVIAANWH